MTMPTGKFPDVVAPAELYAESRRRASARKTRRVLTAASVAIILSAGGAYALTLPSRSPAMLLPGGEPSPRSTQPAVAPTDAQLSAMTGRCDAQCKVVGRIQTREGNTFAVVGRVGSGFASQLPGTVAFVLARGDRLLSSIDPQTSPPVYADSRVPLRTDKTGNVIVPIVVGNSLAYLPFRLVDNTIKLLQGTYQKPSIVGDNNSGIVAVNGNGQLEIVTVGHRTDGSGGRIFSYQSWRWDGTVYRARPCLPVPAQTASTSCGLARYQGSNG